MNEREEEIYIRGQDSAFRAIMSECLRHLPPNKELSLRKERAEVVACLREICDVYGDNDWPDDLHLADVIEKHINWSAR